MDRLTLWYLNLVRVVFKIDKLMRRLLGLTKTVYVQERVGEYQAIWREGAEALGLRFIGLGQDYWEARDDRHVIARMRNHAVSLDDPVTLDLAGDKVMTYRLLAAAGLQVPRYTTATRETIGTIAEFMRDASGPFVVKPARGTASGLGITTYVAGFRQALTAAALAFAYCDEILIEEHLIGESYRLLYLDHELICVSRRLGVRVVGDGKSSLRELAKARFAECGSLSRRWQRDPDAQLTLARQQLVLDSVPGSGESILIRSAPADATGRRETRTVYTENVTEQFASGLIESGRAASLALGSVFCCVDIITARPGEPLSSGGGAINELNTTPGLHHHYGLDGPPIDPPLAARVLDFCRQRQPLD